jgi:hypothetical protein
MNDNKTRPVRTLKRIVFDIERKNRKQNHLPGIGIRQLVTHDPVVSADITVNMELLSRFETTAFCVASSLI